MTKIRNFRSIEINIDGKDVKLAGMAHPIFSYHSRQTDDTVGALKSLGYNYIVSLEKMSCDKLAAQCADADIDHNIIEIPDFEAPSMSDYDNFIYVLKKAAIEDSKVAVHCLGGNGRTGTMLAAALLYSIYNSPILYSTSVTQDELENIKINAFVHVFSGNVNCTLLVAKVIGCIRSLENGIAPSSVETEVQVKFLNTLQARLLTEMKLNPKEAPEASPFLSVKKR